tara:strand:+ start:5316 stop:5786 length:471 start_codon:yes stop_codon:yes gene_type:complete
MESLTEIVALFTIVSNNFSSGTLSCGLREAFIKNIFLAHVISFGVLYNLVVKLYNPKLSGLRLVYEVGLVYLGYVLMVLQVPSFVLFDVALMLSLTACKAYVSERHVDTFSFVSTSLVFSVIVCGIIYSIKLHLKNGGSIVSFFNKSSCKAEGHVT